MRTPFTELVGVPYPIVGFNRSPGVVAAVSNAGGFGVLGASAYTPAELDAQLTWIEEQTAGKPYGVDLLLPHKYVGAERGGIDTRQARELLPEEHRAFVDDLLIRYGIPLPADEQRLPTGDSNIRHAARLTVPHLKIQ